MKHFKLTFLLATLMSMVSFTANAQYEPLSYPIVEIPNNQGVSIYYYFVEDMNLTDYGMWVTNKNGYPYYWYGGVNSDYSGDVVIPESVNYNGTNYTVRGIIQSAFYNCPGLTSITIPTGGTTIDDNAFNGCI